MSTTIWELEGLALEPGEDEGKLKQLASDGLGTTVSDVRIVRRSIDARKKGRPVLRYTVQTVLPSATKVRPKPFAKKTAPEAPLPLVPQAKRKANVVIVGAGPAGLFAALRLKDAGVQCVVLDRGKAVEPRSQDVQRFKRQRVLDTESNYCFGEGGAGTWSDGKLTTRIGDPRTEHVLREIVRLGGPDEVLIDGKPHLGTNRLVKLLRAIRKELLDFGTQIHFQAKADRFTQKDGAVAAVNDHPAEAVILATGHSARDVYTWMQRERIHIEAKSFAMGFRVEHPQALINEIQYGRGAPYDILPAADYRLTDNIELNGDKRGIYSFCMCPGGVIVPTATEPGGICINGMSHASRSSPWANSALVVSVDPKDFGGDGPLAGIEFQRAAEVKAFERGGSDFKAPAQRLVDLQNGKASTDIGQTSFRPGIVSTSLDDIYPAFVNDAIRVALSHWDKRMRGYVSNEAYLLGVETRTSSPVRIVRGEDLQSPSLRGLYPVGEGAGYAGGIMSAAVDGVRAADAIIATLS